MHYKEVKSEIKFSLLDLVGDGKLENFKIEYDSDGDPGYIALLLTKLRLGDLFDLAMMHEKQGIHEIINGVFWEGDVSPIIDPDITFERMFNEHGHEE